MQTTKTANGQNSQHSRWFDCTALMVVGTNVLVTGMGIGLKKLSNPKIQYVIKVCGYKNINAHYRSLENIKNVKEMKSSLRKLL